MSRTINYILFFIVETLFLSSNNAVANTQLPLVPDPLTVNAYLENETPRIGEYFRVILDVDLKDGWSIYTLNAKQEGLQRVKITQSPSSLTAVTPWYETKAQLKRIESLDLALEVHYEKAKFYRNFYLPPDFTPGDQTITFTIHYQPCNDKICLLPSSKQVVVDFSVLKEAPRAEYQLIDKQINDVAYKGGLDIQDGWIAFLLAAFGLGLLSLASPCVLPMIPLSLNYFAAKSDSNRQRLLLLFSFVTSIILSYSLLGLLISAVWGAGAVLDLVSSPFINLVIALLLLFFALSLLGIFKISLPTQLINVIEQKSQHFSLATKSMIIGITFTICSFACNLQLIGSLLVISAKGDFFLPLVGMIVYSSALAFPLALLGLAPKFIPILKSGIWQKHLQSFLAVLMLLVAIRFLTNFDLLYDINILSRQNVLIVLIVMFGLFLLFGIGQFKRWLAENQKSARSLFSWILLLSVYTAAVFLFSFGLNNRSLGSYIDSLLPPPEDGTFLMGGDFIDQDSQPLNWSSNLLATRMNASESNKPMFVNFSGYTCINCRWVEVNIFQNKLAYQKLSEDFELVRLYTDGGDDYRENQDYQIQLFGTVALPYFAIVDPQNQVIASHAGIFEDVDSFLLFTNSIAR